MSNTWRRAASFPPLPEDEIHLWRASLARDEEVIQSLWPLLDDYEQSRARRFHFDVHRRRYIAGRGLLRRLLSAYLDRPPEELEFGYTSHGKPFLQGIEPETGLSFNVSHSHELAVYAVTHRRRLGVDVEHLRDMPSALELAERFFASGEVAALQIAAEHARNVPFFRTWTRKEALLKATGEGLSRPLNSFDVTAPPAQSVLTLTIPDSENRSIAWSLADLPMDDEYHGERYLAALAVEGDRSTLKCWETPF